MLRKKSKTLFIGLPVILVALVITGWALLRLGEQIAGKIIKELVASESNGYYQLSFESLRLDPLEKSILIRELALRPDSTRDFSELGLTNLYHVDLGGISIKLASITNLYFNKELIVNSVRITDPGINLIRQPNAKPQSFGFEAGNLYKAISDYLKVLKIDNFRIEDANFKHFPSNFSLGNIDFFVRNLLLDSAGRSDRIFYSETIELEINNQVFYMPDSVHQITFDRFVLSTRDSVLQFENLNVQRSDRFVAIDGGSDLNLYDIRIPLLSLRGVDYNAAYRENKLHIDELQIADPVVFVEDRTHTIGGAEEDGEFDNSLLKLFFNVFSELRVGKLSLLNAALDLTTDKARRYQEIKTERTDLAFYNLILDSINYRFDRRHSYFDHIDLIVRDYTFVIPDSIHTLHFDLLNLNSRDSSLRFENVDISNNGISRGSLLIDLQVPVFELIGMDYQEALVNKNLFIDRIYAESPYLEIEGTRPSTGYQKITLQQFYDWVQPIFKVIDVKDISLISAALSLAGFEAGRLDLEATGFRVDPGSRSWKKIIEIGKVTLRDISFDGGQVKGLVGSAEYDHKEQQLLLEDGNLNMLNPKDTLSLDVNYVLLSGLDTDGLLNGKFNSFDSMILGDPVVKWTVGQNPNGEMDLMSGTGQSVRVNNGKVHIKYVGLLELKADTLDTEIILGELPAVRHLRLDELHVGLDALHHNLRVRHLVFDDSTSNFFLSGVRLSPDKSTSQPFMDLEIPLLELYGVDQKRIIRSRELVMDSVHIPISDLDIDFEVPGSAKRDSSRWSISANKILLGESNIRVFHKANPWLRRGLTATVNVELRDFQYPERTLINDSSLLYAGAMELNVDELVTSTAEGDRLSIVGTTFSTRENVLRLDSIDFATSDSTFTAMMPGVTISNPNRAAIFRGQIQADTIWIDRPDVHVVVGKPGSLSEVNLTSSIEVDVIEARGVKLNVRDISGTQPYVVHQGLISIRKLSLPESFHPGDLPQHVSSVYFHGKNFEWGLQDDYTLEIGDYFLQYPQQKITLDDVSITSSYSPVEYNRRIDFQRDWFDVEADQIIIDQLDVDQVISTGQWVVQKIDLKGLEGLIYRDKTLPFPTDQVRYLPQRALKDLPVPLHLDTIVITGNIEHQLHPADYHRPGVITFNGINATVLDVTNIDTLIEGPMLFKSTGKLMQTGSFSISVAFDMNDPLDRFSFTGTIRDLPLDSLNRMLEPVAGVKLEAGYGKNIWFDFDANDNLARGTMKFRYNDLKVLILDPETHEDHGLGPGLKTFFANTFVVKKRNPGFIIFPRDGRIFMERDKSRAIFDYWGKALLSGAVSSVGINKSEKAEKEYLKAHGQED